MARLADHFLDLSPLRRNRAFRLLYIARLSSLLSYGVLTVALGVQAYGIAGSSVAVATLMAVSAVSMAVSLLVGGVLADRMDRRRIIVAARTVYLLAIAALIANSLSPAPALWPMMIAALIAGLTGGISLPALGAAQPMLVERDQLPAVAALNSIGIQAGGILGPLAGGIMIDQTGILGAYALVAAGTALTPVLLAFLPSLPPPPDAAAKPLVALADGFRFLMGNRMLSSILLIDSLAMLMAMPLALLPQFATEALGMGQSAVGMLYAAPAAGAFAAALLSGWMRRSTRPGVAIGVAVAVWGLGVAGLSATGSLWMALAFLAVMGFADTVSEILRSALIQSHTPDALRGRVFSFWMMQATVTPALGNLEMGMLTGWIGMKPALRLGGTGCLLLSLGMIGLSRPLRTAPLHADSPTAA